MQVKKNPNKTKPAKKKIKKRGRVLFPLHIVSCGTTHRLLEMMKV